MKFIKKPIIIDAIQWDGTNFDEVLTFVGSSFIQFKISYQEFTIKTLEGEHIASKGDWVIKGVKGEFYPCKPDIFKLTYEQVLEQ